MLQMYAEFLRTVVGNRRRSIMTDRPISYSNYGPDTSPQFIFEQTLATVLKDPNNKKIGLIGRYLEKSTLSAIVEVNLAVSLNSKCFSLCYFYC